MDRYSDEAKASSGSIQEFLRAVEHRGVDRAHAAAPLLNAHRPASDSIPHFCVEHTLQMGNFITNIVEKEIDPWNLHYAAEWRVIEAVWNVIFILEIVWNIYGSFFLSTCVRPLIPSVFPAASHDLLVRTGSRTTLSARGGTSSTCSW